MQLIVAYQKFIAVDKSFSYSTIAVHFSLVVLPLRNENGALYK